jgi:hypothetical protein
MRDDMHKVIVERPRRILGGPARKGRQVRDAELLPSSQSMRRPYAAQWRAKNFDDHIKPLIRYLDKQVGRPWNKVFGEICARGRLDSVVQRHLRFHVLDLVCLSVPPKPDGSPDHARVGTWPHGGLFYVDARNGLLRRRPASRR